MRFLALGWFVLVLAALAPVGARAQEKAPADARADRALFEAARADEAARRWGEALGKLRRILAGRETASLRYHLAYCQEQVGQLSGAYRDYTRALELARATPGPDRKLIVERGGEALKALEGRVPKLEVRIAGDAAPVVMKLDGEVVEPGPPGTPLLVDPGPHTLEVSAPGRKPFRQALALGEYEARSIVVALEKEGARVASAGAALERPRGLRREAPGRPSPALGWALAGSGVALGGVAGGFLAAGWAQQRKLERCRDQPGAYLCDEGAIAATRTRNFALAGASGALSLGAAGAALWRVFGGPPPKSTGAPTLGLVVTPKSVGLKVSF